MTDIGGSGGTTIKSDRHRDLEIQRLQAVEKLRLAGADLARIKAQLLAEGGSELAHW